MAGGAALGLCKYFNGNFAIREGADMRRAKRHMQMAGYLAGQLGIGVTSEHDKIGHDDESSRPDRKWQGRLDSNQRMAVPKTAALPLGYAPAYAEGTPLERAFRLEKGVSRNDAPNYGRRAPDRAGSQ